MLRNIKLIMMVTTLVLLGSRCSPPAPEPPVLPEGNESVTDFKESAPSTGYEFYMNKAQAYSIMRPVNWYWRHYIASEIAATDKEVIDYFITDQKPLLGLKNEYLGLVVIEVSNKPISDYASAVSDFVKSDMLVAGESASRYDGLALSRVLNQPVVEYLFSHNNKTFRVYLNNSADNLNNIKVLEYIVNSFEFK